jgi:hypothetical protein
VSAHTYSMKGPLVDNKNQASRAATEANRRNSRFGPPWLSAPCSAHLRRGIPAVTLRIFPTHGQRSAEKGLGQVRVAPTTRRTN